MSELPIAPVLDEKSEQIKNNAEQILNDPLQNAAFFRHAEQQVAPQPASVEKWDLSEPVVAFDPEKTIYETTPYTAAPEQAIAPKSRAQEIEETLFYRTPAEQVTYGYNITQAVIAYRRAA